MTKDEIIDILKEKDVRIQRDKEKRQWLIVKEINSIRRIGFNDNFYDHQSWKLIDRISEIYDNEEWFQIAAITNRRDSIQHFEALVSKEILLYAIKKYSENVIIVLSPSAKRELLHADNYADLRTDQNIINTIFSHPEIEEFRDFVLNIAFERGNYSSNIVNQAKEVVIKNSPQYKNFSECTSELARNGDNAALKVVINHPEIDNFRDLIVDIALEKIKQSQDITNYTKNLVIQNALQYKFFTKCSLDLARNGNEAALKEAINHPEIDDFRNLIVDIALEKINCSQSIVNQAKRVVIKHALQYEIFAQCSLDLANNGNRDAKKIIKRIIEHPERDVFRYIIKEIALEKKGCPQGIVDQAKDIVIKNALKYDIFAYCTRDLARKGNESALKIIMDHSERSDFRAVIADIALEQNIYFQDVVDHIREIVLQNSLQYDDFAECSLKMARNGDKVFQQLIIRHPENVIFRELIVEIALGEIGGEQDVANLAYDTIMKHPKGDYVEDLPYIHDMKIKLWQKLLKKKGLSDDMMRQNRCSYQEEYCKLSKSELEAKAISFVNQENTKNEIYTQEQWNNALLAKKIPTDKLNHRFFKFESWQKNRSIKYLDDDVIKRVEDATKKRII